jgi:hypothetical protein
LLAGKLVVSTGGRQVGDQLVTTCRKTVNKQPKIRKEMDVCSLERRVYSSRWSAVRAWSITAKVWLQWDRHPFLQCSQRVRGAP